MEAKGLLPKMNMGYGGGCQAAQSTPLKNILQDVKMGGEKINKDGKSLEFNKDHGSRIEKDLIIGSTAAEGTGPKIPVRGASVPTSQQVMEKWKRTEDTCMIRDGNGIQQIFYSVLVLGKVLYKYKYRDLIFVLNETQNAVDVNSLKQFWNIKELPVKAKPIFAQNEQANVVLTFSILENLQEGQWDRMEKIALSYSLELGLDITLKLNEESTRVDLVIKASNGAMERGASLIEDGQKTEIVSCNREKLKQMLELFEVEIAKENSPSNPNSVIFPALSHNVILRMNDDIIKVLDDAEISLMEDLPDGFEKICLQQLSKTKNNPEKLKTLNFYQRGGNYRGCL